jgi:hypothetical protein
VPSEVYAYYVESEILHWEDRATEWSGIPARIEIKISIYDSSSNAEITAVVVSGRSKWGIFGGDHPQDLLHERVNSYVQGLPLKYLIGTASSFAGSLLSETRRLSAEAVHLDEVDRLDS